MNGWSFLSLAVVAVVVGFSTCTLPESAQTVRSTACMKACGSVGGEYVETRDWGGVLTASTCTCATPAKP